MRQFGPSVMTAVHRSYLFAPGNHARRVEKALSLGADAVILDLEDAVAISEKAAARPLVVAALRRPRLARAYVRVNAPATSFCHADIAAVIGPGLDGIMIPKIETPAELFAIDWLIGQIERERGLPLGAIDLLPIIETGKGVANVGAIAATGTRARRLSFGAGDFTLDMGIAWTRDEAELAHARASIALASRAAGLEPPLDSVWADLEDAAGFRASCERVKAMGYQGKMCIHPDQIGAVNEVFAPSPAETAWSERVIAAFKTAERQGLASIQLDGQFIDYPIMQHAERMLAARDRITSAGKGRGST